MALDHLGHVHLKVRDVDRAVAFYTDVLDGLTVTERVGGFAFLTLGEHHHDLALQGVPTADVTPEPGEPSVGLYHAAWEVQSTDDLRATYERLMDRGVAVSPIDHGISLALYFDDPDGNGVEVYLDRRDVRDRESWEGENRRFDPTDL